MEIEIHGFVVAIRNISDSKIQELTNDVLHLDYMQYSKKEYNDRLTLIHSFKGKGESVSIHCGSSTINGEYGYVKINLHGSFFDNSPEFKFEELVSFLSQFKNTPKQLDVAFNDNKNCLSIAEVERWCDSPDDYCIGSLVRRLAPGLRRIKRKFDRIELASASSKTNYGTIYVRPDTDFIRFEIKFRKSEKIQYLLEDYSIHNVHQFNTRSLEALVGCINFIKPSSRGKRNGAKDVKQPAWKSFLASDINKINWNKLKRDKEDSRHCADNYTFDKKLKRLASMLQNLVSKASIIFPEDEVFNKLSEYSGYIVMRNKPVSDSYHNCI